MNNLTEEKHVHIIAVANGNACAYTSVMGDPGLTKRELFAAMAMQGAMQGLGADSPNCDPEEAIDPEAVAIDAVKMADALLKELAK